MKIAVLGGGAWGTALAASVSARHPTLLWVRDTDQAASLALSRCNERYLPELRLPDALRSTASLAEALAHGRAGLVVIATPVAGLRRMLECLPDDAAAIWLCKGFEEGSGALGHELSRQLRPGRSCGVLSGPSFALEVARGQPTALVAASEDPSLVAAAVQAFHSESLRVYASSDIVGVEVGGAVKNVLAIATGILDGMAAGGLNARAALITRGLAEMTRLGLALGARAETFMGLSGLGDLVLTATGDLSRNRRIGLLLAAGQPLAQALASLGHVAEGVPAAAMVLSRAQSLGVEMPITEAVVQVLQAQVAPDQALSRLMAREARTEALTADEGGQTAQIPPS